MAANKVGATNSEMNTAKTLNFDVSTGLKRVLGRELITNDEVAIFELVKNSFDAGANTVNLHFGDDSVVIAEDYNFRIFEVLLCIRRIHCRRQRSHLRNQSGSQFGS